MVVSFNSNFQFCVSVFYFSINSAELNVKAEHPQNVAGTANQSQSR